MTGIRTGPSFTLVLVTPEGLTRHRLPAEGSVTIGRGDDSTIRVDDVSVSRRHAVLHVGTELRLEDLGGANGTHIQVHDLRHRAETRNLKALRGEEIRIAPGDRILIGAASMLVQRTSTDSDDSVSPHIVLDPRMVELHAQIERAADSLISVLLLGETGVGKEILARSLHARSSRRDGPFLAINCAALPESLLEAELFGHEKGAFTGAVQSRSGLFESADRGTLFLDEIGEMPLTTQAKLLRVLEDRKVMRVGGRTAKNFDVRFVSASNRDLETLSGSGEFRSDLYFRLAGLTLPIPPLCERPTEIAPLARALLQRACDELGRPPLQLAEETIVALERYAWPGNVRELKNAMERAAVLAAVSPLRPEHLPPRMLRKSGDVVAVVSTRPLEAGAEDMAGLHRQMREVERKRIVAALERCAGNQTRAAEHLGISRRTLIKRLSEYNLRRPRKSD